MVDDQGKLIVAALRSGNNTTVVGEPFLFALNAGGASFFPNLIHASNFSLTPGLRMTVGR